MANEKQPEKQDFFNVDPSEQSLVPQVKESMGTPISNLVEDYPFLQATAVIPTGVPSNPLQKIRLYVNGAVRRLYIYDSTNNTWRFSVLT